MDGLTFIIEVLVLCLIAKGLNGSYHELNK